MNKKFEDIHNILEKFKKGGIKNFENGTHMICHVPHIAPEAWLHIIYNKLSDIDILNLKNKLNKELPLEFEEFLKCSNGLNIFSDSLSVWGMRSSYNRKETDSIQPYDLIMLNEERPIDCPESWLFFGGYSWDGSRVFFDIKNGINSNEVYLCSPDSINIIYKWSSFNEWITDEVNRLANMYNEEGIEYDEDIPTSPTILL